MPFLTMQTSRAILVAGPRLMRELLKHAIEKFIGFEVTREVDNMGDALLAIAETSAEWLFVALSPGEDMPENFKTQLFSQYPALRIICLWIDGSRVKMEWLGRKEKNLTKPTLDEFETLLHERLMGRT